MGRKRKVPSSHVLPPWEESDDDTKPPGRSEKRLKVSESPSSTTFSIHSPQSTHSFSGVPISYPHVHSPQGGYSSDDSFWTVNSKVSSPRSRRSSASSSLNSPWSRHSSTSSSVNYRPRSSSMDSYQSPISSPHLCRSRSRSTSPLTNDYSPDEEEIIFFFATRHSEYDDSSDEVERNDYFDLLTQLSKQWLLIELHHQVSKSASNSFWQLALSHMNKLFNMKQHQGVRRKIPQYCHLRRNLNKNHSPPIDLEFGFVDKSSNTLEIVRDVEHAPSKMFPPSKFRKVYEIATVKASKTITIFIPFSHSFSTEKTQLLNKHPFLLLFFLINDELDKKNAAEPTHQSASFNKESLLYFTGRGRRKNSLSMSKFLQKCYSQC